MDRYRGKVYRQCHPDHTDFDATMRASRRHPFRFNPLNEFGVLYVALDQRTARAELERQAFRLGVPISSFAPRVMLHIYAELESVLDLTKPAIRRAYGISPADLGSDDYTRCQAVARIARARGFEAIRYPSATGAGENLAIFHDVIRPGSRLTVEQVEILPLVS